MASYWDNLIGRAIIKQSMPDEQIVLLVRIAQALDRVYQQRPVLLAHNTLARELGVSQATMLQVIETINGLDGVVASHMLTPYGLVSALVLARQATLGMVVIDPVAAYAEVGVRVALTSESAGAARSTLGLAAREAVKESIVSLRDARTAAQVGGHAA